jgi:hypothetical protein
MVHLRFVKSNMDKCLYILCEKGQVILLVLVYVDDATVASKQLKHIEEFKQRLREFFPIKDLSWWASSYSWYPGHSRPRSMHHHVEPNWIHTQH